MQCASDHFYDYLRNISNWIIIIVISHTFFGVFEEDWH